MQTVSRLNTYFTPRHYNLSLAIDRHKRSFDGIVSIKGIVKNNSELRVHAKALVIENVHINGREVTFRSDENDEMVLEYTGQLDEEVLVTIAYSGTITDQMHGMYPCYYEHDGEKKELLATQFESHHAREVLPCIDEPEAKASFDVTLTTETGVQVLGNMPVKTQNTENNQLITTFETTPIMSSYLLAWVIGELHKKTATTKSGVEVNVWATPAQPAESLDFALDIATRTIDFFDDYFGVPYPLPKSDHVALPDFSSGAMENWGLITYREIALLANPAITSIGSKRYIATVVAHELSHQWFGNLVTMKWWNDLWLNESFATIMEYVAVDALHPEWNSWLDFASHESVMALRRDSIDGVQPVQVDVNHPDEITTLFDPAIVYAKGARLLSMLREYVGDEALRTGLKAYFTKHQYANTEANDLWQALSESSGKDIASFMTAWISQPGFPVVTATPHGLSQTQFFVGPHAPSDRVWPVPLGCPGLPDILPTSSLDIDVEPGMRLNPHNTSHYITHYAPALLEAIIAEIPSSKPVQRLQLLNEQMLLARSGAISSADLLPLLDAYSNETVESVWDLIGATIGELKKFVETDDAAENGLRALSGALATKQFARLGWEKQPNESDEDTKLRSVIVGMMVYSRNADVLAKANELYTTSSLDSLDPELRPIIIGSAVRDNGVEIVRDLFTKYAGTQNADLQLDICSGITSTKDPEAITLILGTLKDTAVIRSQDVARWFAYMIRNKYARQATWQWMKDNWEWIELTFGGDKSFDNYPRYSANGISTPELLADYKQFFAPLSEEPALKRIIALGISEIEGRIETIARDGDIVRNTLKSNRNPTTPIY